LNKLGQQYAKRGVLILAINIGERKSRYNSFIKSKNYEYLKWSRDSTGELSKLYRVRGIPMTYVLAGEGIVRYKHVGYSEGMGKTLAREVESLLE
jgi:hypothetical protein